MQKGTSQGPIPESPSPYCSYQFYMLYSINMKVTSKTLYTLHFLTALAIKSKDLPGRPIHLREIAQEYNIPFKFLEQIAILMKSVGLVRGARGKLGGYQLADPPENIHLARIIKATEGEILPCAEIEGGNEVVLGSRASRDPGWPGPGRAEIGLGDPGPDGREGPATTRTRSHVLPVRLHDPR